ncbi:MAG: matrixin family metalloprotease [Bryobacteraceae bacterium]
MTFPKRVLTIAAALTALSSLASGYYHFVYFAGRSGPFTPINLRFDLTKLTNNTVYYFISDQGPNVFVPGDSFTAEISELQLAANAWNNVPSSQIKLAYGGLENYAGTQQSSPGIDVMFSDDNIAVGILAQTKVTTLADVTSISGGTTTFLPILRSTIQFRKNLTVTVPQQASFYDSSFTTMVHEFGHSLGLQHTLTSATMSTYITRSTTKAAPLAADDVAGLSLLYPTPGYLATTGSISGQVVLAGSMVNLASVVALSITTGAAISNLTNPDGSFEIDAIPPGNYLLYVHPLPPPAQGEVGPDAIVLPLDPAQTPFSPVTTGFVTQFYSQSSPGTRDWTQATPVTVSAGNIASASFAVQGSAGPQVYAMELAGSVNNAVEFSPMLEANGGYSMEFLAPGTVVNNNQLAPGLSVSFIGGSAPASIAPGYGPSYFEDGYVSMGIYTSAVSATTPVAIAVTVNNDLYVLPAAFFVVPNGPPTLTNSSTGTGGDGSGTLTVSGSNLSSATQFVFDGTPAAQVVANSDGSFTLWAPLAPASYSSSIEALNPDGQTSGQAIPGGTPLQYQYNYVNPAAITSVSPHTVSPGTDVMIQIIGDNTNFNAQTPIVGFGSSDIVVKQVFVISATELQVNVEVNAAAPITITNVTVTSGLQTATFSLDLGTGAGLQIAAPNTNQISMIAPVTDLATGLAGVLVGGIAAINLTSAPGLTGPAMPGWTLYIGGQPTIPAFVNGQVIAIVPGGMTPGPVTVQLTPPSGPPIPSILMKIDAPPPVIGLILNSAGAVSPTTQVHPGDTLIVNVSSFGDGITPVTIPNIFVTLDAVNGQGGISVPVLALASNISSIQIQIPTTVPNNPASPLTVGIGTRVSAPVPLNIHN